MDAPGRPSPAVARPAAGNAVGGEAERVGLRGCGAPAEAPTLGEAHLRRLRIVRQAEAILLRGPCAPALRLRTACCTIGISARALHHAFVAVHGMSPGRYLRERRLALVHEALRVAPERRSAVKQAALALGFRHLGHFARAYRDRFGELPSDTIARALASASAEDGPALHPVARSAPPTAPSMAHRRCAFRPPAATAKPVPQAP